MAFLSPAEIAKKYGFSPSQIRRMIRAGIIKAEKVGFFYVIDEKDVKHLERRRHYKEDKTT